MTKALKDLDVAATLQSLMDDTIAEIAGPRPPTSKARSEQIAKAIDAKDADELLALQDRLKGMIDQIVVNTIDPNDLHECSEEQLYSLMVELLDQKDIKRLIEVRYKMIREQIFHHITEANRWRGIPEPHRVPGEAPVPALGKKFARRGGRLIASLDEEKLRKVLGPKRWKKIITEKTVPATEEHVEQVVDEDKVLDLVRSDPKMLEVFRQCVVASGYTAQSLQIENMG